MNTQDVLLAEYKTLREELIMHIKQSQQVLAWSGTLAVATVGLCFKVAPSVPADSYGIILLAILTPLALVYRHECFVIGKIASYIQNRIETRLDNLNWKNRDGASGCQII